MNTSNRADSTPRGQSSDLCSHILGRMYQPGWTAGPPGAGYASLESPSAVLSRLRGTGPNPRGDLGRLLILAKFAGSPAVKAAPPSNAVWCKDLPDEVAVAKAARPPNAVWCKDLPGEVAVAKTGEAQGKEATKGDWTDIEITPPATPKIVPAKSDPSDWIMVEGLDPVLTP